MIYCCPGASPVKSRLVYSASVRGVAHRAADYGITVVKRVRLATLA
jgi:hypothetical protein